MKNILFFFIFLFIIQSLISQSLFCPNDPPLNTHLADSPYPIYHRNNYAQASTCISGPVKSDSLITKVKSRIRGGTSPWVYFTEKYQNGKRALLYSNATHVFKLIDNGTTIETIDSLRIDFESFTSFGWNFLLAKNKIWYTYDPKYDTSTGASTKIYKLTDVDTADIYSDIKVIDTFDFGIYGINRVQHYSLNYDGHIVFNSDNNISAGYGTVGIISQNFVLLDTLRFATDSNEITNHNAFPIDENNSFYITTNKRLIKFQWDGTNLSLAWSSYYDFVGNGPVGTFAEGSGTTPTLVGWGSGKDKLVVMSDGHSKNNLLAFWRELPAGWVGKPGMDIHFADSIQLPLAVSFNNLFQSIENSPTVFGYDIAIAQFNGFLGYSCNNYKGVQKVRWDTNSNSLSIVWATDSINMNGVLSYSSGSNLVYSSGKESDCNYYLYGLDWNTGRLELKHLLGPEGSFLNDPFYDAGNNLIIDEVGDIYFAGGASLVKVEKVNTVSISKKIVSSEIRLFPNPTSEKVTISLPKHSSFIQISIYNSLGQKVMESNFKNQKEFVIDPGNSLPSGIYYLNIATDNQYFSKILMIN